MLVLHFYIHFRSFRVDGYPIKIFNIHHYRPFQRRRTFQQVIQNPAPWRNASIVYIHTRSFSYCPCHYQKEIIIQRSDPFQSKQVAAFASPPFTLISEETFNSICSSSRTNVENPVRQFSLLPAKLQSTSSLPASSRIPQASNKKLQAKKTTRYQNSPQEKMLLFSTIRRHFVT